jgi:hypothetical protein
MGSGRHLASKARSSDMTRKHVRVVVTTAVVLVLGLLACLLLLRYPLWVSTDMSKHDPLATFAGEADSVVLWEGLPHQNSEAVLYHQELQKATVRFHGWRFYAQPLELKAEDARRLTALFCGKSSFQKYRGEKKCGGFHPDWCVEWRNGHEVCRALLCFGCSEMKAFGPWAALHCDINRGAYIQFERLLEGYQKNRPTAAGAGPKASEPVGRATPLPSD